MILRWLGLGRVGSPPVVGEVQEPASPFPTHFAFENRIVVRHGAPLFEPLKDSTHRWYCIYNHSYSVLGQTAEVLYELKDGAFVHVFATRLKPSPQTASKLWDTESSLEVKTLTPREAFLFFLKHQGDGPSAGMRKLLEEYNADPVAFLKPATRPQRSIEWWAENRPPSLRSRKYSHEVDPREVWNDTLLQIQEAVEELRGILGTCKAYNLRHYMFRTLYQRYPVDPWRWKGADRPPESVAIEELDPALSSTRVPAIAASLRRLVDGPFNLFAAERNFDLPRDEAPTEEEVESGVQYLRDKLPELIDLSVDLKRSLEEVYLKKEPAEAPPSAQSSSIEKLPIRVQRAYAASVRACSELGEVSDQEIHTWLAENGEEIGYEAPAFPSFTRYLSDARAALGTPKRKSQSGIATRSVRPVDELRGGSRGDDTE